jgi:peptide/nickel transport system substrate-binding protein
MRSLLRQLGYRPSIRTFTSVQAVFDFLSSPKTPAQVATTGWLTDYPAASGFLLSLVSCTSPSNLAHFCDRRIEHDIGNALRVQATDPAAAGALWAKIDREVTDRAPYAVTSTAKHIGFVSRRIGNYQFNPQWGVLLDQLWVR